MGGWIRKTAIIGIGLILAGAAVAAPMPAETDLSATEKSLADASNRFGFRLFKEVVESDPSGNVFISPLSVSFALAMAVNGADGQTLEAMRMTLQLADFPGDDINASYKNLMTFLTGTDSLVNFEIANSIWYRDGLPVNDRFIGLNRDNFDARVEALNFNAASAADAINGWVSEKTHEKIKNIVSPPIDPATIMFLINAIYFKGSWTEKFEKAATQDHPFYPAEGREVKCRMMFNTSEFEYFENDLFQAINLPYGDKGFSMMVFLPRLSVSVDDLIGRMNEEDWSIWQKSLHQTKVELGLPRFKFEYEVTMNDMLETLGMAIAFDGDKADFSRMLAAGGIPGRNVFISQVKHKTFLQVDEEGTEAAAVTSVTMALTSAVPMRPPVMIVERPFLFAIQDRISGSVLFVGKVVNPVWEE